jgi:hypothetical protein
MCLLVEETLPLPTRDFHRKVLTSDEVLTALLRITQRAWGLPS